MSKALITLKPPKTPLGKALVVLPFGIIFLLIAYSNYKDEQFLSTDFKVMKGKVESIRSRSNSRHVTYIIDKQAYHVRTGWFSPYKDANIGDEVEVMVSNRDPQIASVNSPYDRYEVIVITAVTGSLIVLLALFLLKGKTARPA
ncbi:MAG TPA: hypothetical protein DGG95_14405 [Cytophagales bacterium]|jgi:hypothetical protein|nr:hypothetical protein [Cytophagales bacterium]